MTGISGEVRVFSGFIPGEAMTESHSPLSGGGSSHAQREAAQEFEPTPESCVAPVLPDRIGSQVSDRAGLQRRVGNSYSVHGHLFKKYRVRVGLAECTVFCNTEEEAVRLARIKIGQQMPKFRAVLYNIQEKEFRVDLADR